MSGSGDSASGASPFRRANDFASVRSKWQSVEDEAVAHKFMQEEVVSKKSLNNTRHVSMKTDRNMAKRAQAEADLEMKKLRDELQEIEKRDAEIVSSITQAESQEMETQKRAERDAFLKLKRDQLERQRADHERRQHAAELAQRDAMIAMDVFNKENEALLHENRASQLDSSMALHLFQAENQDLLEEVDAISRGQRPAHQREDDASGGREASGGGAAAGPAAVGRDSSDDAWNALLHPAVTAELDQQMADDEALARSLGGMVDADAELARKLQAEEVKHRRRPQQEQQHHQSRVDASGGVLAGVPVSAQVRAEVDAEHDEFIKEQIRAMKQIEQAQADARIAAEAARRTQQRQS